MLGTVFLLPCVILLWGRPWLEWGRFDPLWLLLPIGLFASGIWAGVRRGGLAAERVGFGLKVWRWLDPWFAALMIQTVLFRPPETVGVPLLIFLTLGFSVLVLRQLPGPALVTLGSMALMLFVVLPRAFETIILSRVAATYALDVDHRMKPDGVDINSDGLRFRGESEDLEEEDFVVLFLGDSFTFGFNLPYESSFPYRLQAIASESRCSDPIRVVNMGWTSSSPLLGLRLLREVGYRYQPDLVVYSLDMTDFHDDLRYEWMLREQFDYDFDARAIVGRWIATEWPWARSLRPIALELTGRLRSVDRKNREELLAGLSVPTPDERFFITDRPLSETRPAIELGTMKNLFEIDQLVREVLGAEMVLMVYPRAYQYSEREVPMNWEGGYVPLGPYVREPFDYLAEVAPTLPYPVLDLLPAFEETERFPLFFSRDPHWNAQGANLAAEATYRGLVELGALPCALERPSL